MHVSLVPGKLHDNVFFSRGKTLFIFSFHFLPNSWGGCIVAICNSLEQSSKYINELKAKYFNQLPDYNEYDADNVVFVTNPQSGATIYLSS